MQLLDWPFLDAFQTGALAALFVSFATDALSRRDRMIGWLALGCLLVGLRHAVLAFASQPAANLEFLDRVQSLLVAFGFLALCMAFTELFPRHVPRRFPAWIALALLPNYLRNLALPHPSLADTWMLHASHLGFLTGCGAIVYWTFRARQAGDPMGVRLFVGISAVTLPVVVEIAAYSFFGLKVRLSGFSLLILAMAIGTSWQWLVVTSLEERLQQAEAEGEIWRSLVPGNAFRTDHPSPVMDGIFGAGWADQVRQAPDAPLVALDGTPYRLLTRALNPRERLGWYEREDETQPGAHGFLSGWTVALGMEESPASARIHGWLRSWGAEVQVWGTVPPREGPYPSVLIWAREPSILSVWREDDLLRRRSRWVQLGGPVTPGPHARLGLDLDAASLRDTLRDLLSRR